MAQGRQYHEFCKIFPALSDVDLQQLADDIEKNGQRHPIVIDEDGAVLDGRNRLAACQLRGVEPEFEVFRGSDAEKLEFVVSLNLSRRHLDSGQRAMVASKLATLRHGVRSDRDVDAGIPASTITQSEAAERLNVSRDSVQAARKIQEQAAPEVVEAVERGELSLNKAAKLTKAQPDKQKQAKAVASGTVDREIQKAAPEKPRVDSDGHVELTAVIAGRDITRNFAVGSMLVIDTDGPRKLAKDELLAACFSQFSAADLLRILVSSTAASDAAKVSQLMVRAAGALDPDTGNKSGSVPTVQQLRSHWLQLADGEGVSQALVQAVTDWAEHKQSLPGKDKIRTLKSWGTALRRILNVASSSGDGVVCEMIDKAIANGWKGWEHDSGKAGQHGRRDVSRVRRGAVAMEFDEVL